MKSDDYQKKAMETATQDFDVIRGRMNPSSLSVLKLILELSLVQGHNASSIKRQLFYGKEPKAGSIEPDYAWNISIDRCDDRIITLIHSVLGMMDEMGEIVEIIRDYFKGVDLDIDHLVEEYGDSEWYSSLGIHGIGKTLSEVQQKNNEKLLGVRYKKGFSEEAALTRDLNAERDVFESEKGENSNEE